MKQTLSHAFKRILKNKILIAGVFALALFLNIAILSFQCIEHQNFHSSVSFENSEMKEVEVSISSQVFFKLTETIKDVFVLKS